jgi:hypothetical protein
MMKSLLVAGFCAFASGGAWAQSAFETRATTIAEACMAATPANNAPAAVNACQQMLNDIDGLKAANPTLSGHDWNVYYIVSAMGQSRIGNAYGIIDGARTARVCERVERAWDMVSRTNASASPGYTDMINNLRQTTIGTTRLCRNEKGTPVGATPLP